MQVIGSYGIQQLIDYSGQPAGVKAALQGINTLLYMETGDDLGSVAMLSNVGILRYDATPAPAGIYLYTNTNTSFPPINDEAKWTRVTSAVLGATTQNITSWAQTINAGYGIASGLLSNMNKVPAMRGHFYYAWDTRQLYIYAPDSNLGATTLGWRLLSDGGFAGTDAELQRKLGTTRILVPAATGTAFSFAGKQLNDVVQVSITQVQWLDGSPPTPNEGKWTNPPNSDQLVGSLVWDTVNNIFGIVYAPLVSNTYPQTCNVRIILVVGNATISIVDKDDPTSIHGSFTTNQATSANIKIPHVGDGTITFQNSDATTDLDSFKVNQDADKVIKLGNATLKLVNSNGANPTTYGTFTANASTDKTITLPNAANNGQITIQDNKASPATPSTFGTFTVDQAGDTTISIPAVYDATITIDDEDQHASPGSGNHGTFTVNQSGDKTITIPAVRNSTITLQAKRDTTTAEIGHFTLNQGASDTLDIGNGLITLTNAGGTTTYGTFGVNDTASKSIALASQANDATITIKDSDQTGTEKIDTFTVDQATDKTITIPAVRDTPIDFIGYGLDNAWTRSTTLNALATAPATRITIATAKYNGIYLDISNPTLAPDSSLNYGFVRLDATANNRMIKEHLEYLGYSTKYNRDVGIGGASGTYGWINEHIDFTGLGDYGLFANDVSINIGGNAAPSDWYSQLSNNQGPQQYERHIQLDPIANNSVFVEHVLLDRTDLSSGYEHSLNVVDSSTSNTTRLGLSGTNLKYVDTQLVSTSSDSSITEYLMDTAGSGTGFKQNVALSGNRATDSRSLSLIGNDAITYSRSTDLNPSGTSTIRESLSIDPSTTNGYEHNAEFSSGAYSVSDKYNINASTLAYTYQVDNLGPARSYTLDKAITGTTGPRDRSIVSQSLYSMNMILNGDSTSQAAQIVLGRANSSTPASLFNIMLVDDTSRLTATLMSSRYSYALKADTDLLQKQDASSIIADAQSAINNSTITFEYANGTQISTFTLNQASDVTIKLDDVNNGQIRILNSDGTLRGAFTVNQSNNTDITLPAVQTLYRHTTNAQINAPLPSGGNVMLQFTFVQIDKKATAYSSFQEMCLAASKIDETAYGSPSWVSVEFIPQAVSNATEQVIDAKYSFQQDPVGQFKSKLKYTIADLGAMGAVTNMLVTGDVTGNNWQPLSLVNDHVSTCIMQ